jgi:hypothetical protein
MKKEKKLCPVYDLGKYTSLTNRKYCNVSIPCNECKIYKDDKKIIKEKLLKSLKRTDNTLRPVNENGFSVGLVPTDITFESEEFSIKITVGYHRSQLKNSELAIELMNNAIDIILKDEK